MFEHATQPRIGFHASHELYAPSTLLDYARRAQAAGFKAGSSSDHFHPWSMKFAGCGFSWSWLGAALASTELTFGVVCAPGQRYHPAIVAQAIATLVEMYPGRFWVAIGSGEALNECITGGGWPSKQVRNERLKEAADLMRALWRGETVSHDGHIRVENATLTLQPAEPPPLFVAALSAETAAWAGSWADGLLTAGAKHDELKKIVEAFCAGGGEGKPILLQSAISWGDTDEEALRAAHQRWPQLGLTSEQLADTATPQEFDRLVKNIRPADIAGSLRCSASLQQHLDWLKQDLELGFAAIYLHYLGSDVPRFLDAFGERVLPELPAH